MSPIIIVATVSCRCKVFYFFHIFFLYLQIFKSLKLAKQHQTTPKNRPEIRLVRLKHTLVRFPCWYGWFGLVWIQLSNSDADHNDRTKTSPKRELASELCWCGSLAVWTWSSLDPTQVQRTLHQPPSPAAPCSMKVRVSWYGRHMCFHLLRSRPRAAHLLCATWSNTIVDKTLPWSAFKARPSLLDMWPRWLLHLRGDAKPACPFWLTSILTERLLSQQIGKSRQPYNIITLPEMRYCHSWVQVDVFTKFKKGASMKNVLRQLIPLLKLIPDNVEDHILLARFQKICKGIYCLAVIWCAIHSEEELFCFITGEWAHSSLYVEQTALLAERTSQSRFSKPGGWQEMHRLGP